MVPRPMGAWRDGGSEKEEGGGEGGRAVERERERERESVCVCARGYGRREGGAFASYPAKRSASMAAALPHCHTDHHAMPRRAMPFHAGLPTHAAAHATSRSVWPEPTPRRAPRRERVARRRVCSASSPFDGSKSVVPPRVTPAPSEHTSDSAAAAAAALAAAAGARAMLTMRASIGRQ